MLLPTSVKNYDKIDDLLAVLKRDVEVAKSLAVNDLSGEEKKDVDDIEQQLLGWFLENLDISTCEEQDVQKEATRLMNLKSFNILDRESETTFQLASAPEFDRITARAKEIFKAPISVISMVDAGRQYFLSNGGDLPVRETPRDCAFCAHVIQTNDGLMVIDDATKDPRFMNNPLVTDGLKIRFYAGAKVTSPEGEHLGTVCVIDFEPRPDGITPQQACALRDLAHQAMNAIMSHWLLEEL